MLKLWDADTGREMRSMGGHTGTITSVYLVPNTDLSCRGKFFFNMCACHESCRSKWMSVFVVVVFVFLCQAACDGGAKKSLHRFVVFAV